MVMSILPKPSCCRPFMSGVKGYPACCPASMKAWNKGFGCEPVET